jgi:hypothetical protein
MLRVGARIFLNEEHYQKVMRREIGEGNRHAHEVMYTVPKFFMTLRHKLTVWWTQL